MVPTNAATRTRNVLTIALATALLLLLASCTVQKNKDGDNENVKIQTPVGGMSVDTNGPANASEVGLAIYPGAKLNPKSDGEHSSANVNISSSLFGVKVVALDYLSDDPPQKLIDYYKKELGKYGDVLQCKDVASHDHGQLRCAEPAKPGSDKMELAVGTEERQHIVSIKPHGSGSQFSLVYVQTHGKEGTL